MVNADHLRDANPWHPITVPIDLKHLGKLCEEACELAAVTTACMMAFHGRIDLQQAQELEDEIADVRANSVLVIRHFKLERPDIVSSTVGNPFTYLGFLSRQASKLGQTASRCIIQGLDEEEPVTHVLNRHQLEIDIWMTLVRTDYVSSAFGLDRQRMTGREDRKIKHLGQWHNML